MRTRASTFGFIVLLGILVALLVYRSGLVSWPDGQNVLADGGFEDGTQPGGPFQPDSSGVMSIPPNRTTIPGWTVLGAPTQDVAWGQNDNRFVFPNAARDGTHFLDLTGINDRPLPGGDFGGVAQTFSTKPRMPYQLSFDIGVMNPTFPGPITVVAMVSSSPAENPYAQTTCGPFNPPGVGPLWTTCQLRFTAATGSTYLKIFGSSGARYIGLDRASVECVAPLGRPGFCS